MSQSPIIYEASVYSRTVAYKNFKGEVSNTELHFALDPLQLMEIIAGFEPKKVKSGNPAKNGTTEITDEQQLKFIRDLASKSAGFPSEDGETWEAFEGFADSIAGKAFLTQLAASDGDRKDFAEKVVLQPFRDYVGFAEADPSNTQKDLLQFKTQLTQLENIFKAPEQAGESLEEKRARLAAELAAAEAAAAEETE